MTIANRDLLLRILIVVVQLGSAWVIASQVLLRKRNKAFISPFEKTYASVTSLIAATLMLVDGVLTVTKNDVASATVYAITTAAVLMHFLGVLFIHLRALRSHGQLK